MEQQSYMNLPTHIIEEEILLWLPVKTLLRFKCVCKRWLSLIQSRSFIDRHYCRERDDDRLVLCPYYDYKPYLDERLIEVDPNPRFPQSEDIVELMGPQLGLFCQVNLNDIILFNPATKMLKRVAPPKLLFPTISPRYGFGLYPLTRDYEMVIFHPQALREHTTLVYIYNSTSDSWKVIEALPVDSMNNADVSNIKTFMNGVYYWLMWLWPLGDGIKDRAILAFDMRIERFREIQLPHDTAHKEIVHICARHDSLALLAFKFQRVDIWVMGEEGFWTRSFWMDTFQTWSIPHCMWKNDLVFSLFSIDYVILIDIYTKKERKIAISEKISELINSSLYQVFFYKESIVSIKGEHSYRIG